MRDFVTIREIPEMRERLAKGCATDCSGECGDCTRFGIPIEIKGRLYLAEGSGRLPQEFCESSLYVIFAYDREGCWIEELKRLRDALGDNACFFCGSTKDAAEDMIREAKPLDMAGCFTASEGSCLSRMGDLKDTENIILDPSSCAAFEGVRYAMAGAPHFKQPDEDAIIIVWTAAPSPMDFEEFLAYYEKSKRL